MFFAGVCKNEAGRRRDAATLMPHLLQLWSQCEIVSDPWLTPVLNACSQPLSEATDQSGVP